MHIYGYDSHVFLAPHVITHMDLDMSPCLHIIAHMGMDMAPCPYIGYGYDSMDVDIEQCVHIITHMFMTLYHSMSAYLSLYIYYLLLIGKDLDIAPCLHVITHMALDMSPCLHGYIAYYHSHGYGYDSMSVYLSL